MAGLFALVGLASALDVAVLVSDLTPFSMSDVLLSVSSSQHIELVQVDISKSMEEVDSFEIVVDYTYSLSLSKRLAEIPGVLVVCMHTFCPDEQTSGRLSAKSTAAALSHYLNSLHCTELLLAVTVSPFFQDLAYYLSEQETLRLASVMGLSPEASNSEIELFVGRLLKPAGSRIAALLVDAPTGEKVVPLLSAYHIAQEGYVYFVSDEAAWTAPLNGMLYVTDSVAATARSRLEYEVLLLSDLLTHLTASRTPRTLSAALINIVNDVPKLVASSPASQIAEIVYIGNVTSLSKLAKPVIQVSADFTAANFDGTDFPLTPLYMDGLFLAYSEVNGGNEITPNYRFVNKSISFGGSKWNEKWARSQIEVHRREIGVAYHHFAFSSSLYGLLPLLVNESVIVPVTTMCFSDSMLDPARFPLVFRTSSGSDTSARVMVRFFKLFGWRRCAVIYSNSRGDLDFYNSFVSYADSQGISIVNNETNRLVPLFGQDLEAQMNRTVMEILESTVRIIVITHAAAYKVMVRMYDMGVRAGEYLLCMGYESVRGQTEEDDFKIRQVARGGLIFFEKYFMGAQGPFVRKKLQERQGSSFLPSACMFFDHAMLIAHAVGFMLARGQHFEDGHELAKTIRSTRFNGCLSAISIEQGTNNKRPGDYSMMNLQSNDSSDAFEMVEVGIYSPAKTQLFHILPTLRFPDGSSTYFPDSWLLAENCPYFAKDIKKLPQGVGFALAINGWFVCVTSVSAVAGWTQWRQHLVVLTEVVSLTWEDSLAMLSILVEFAQLLALGPELGTAEIDQIARISILRWEEWLGNRAVYWIVMTCLYCWVGVLVVQCCVHFWPLCASLKELSCCANYWWSLFFPAANKVLFVPVCVTLLDTFQCEETTGSWKESYLRRDCYERCWRTDHATYVSLSTVSLHLFLPLYLLTLPHWQVSLLHVKESSLYLLVKTVAQLLLVCVYVTLRTAFPQAHAISYVAVTGLCVCGLLCTRVYAYERVNMWTRLLMLALFLYGVIGLIHRMEPAFSREYSVIALAVCSGTLLILGVAIQTFVLKYRNMLTRDKEDRYDIIKFAFTFGQTAQNHLKAFQEKRKRAQYTSNELSVQADLAESRF